MTSIQVRLQSGRKLKVKVYYEKAGLCITPWIVVCANPYPAKDFFAVTHTRSGAIIVNAPYASVGEARMVLERIMWLAPWQETYKAIMDAMQRGRLEKLREVLSDEVYQAAVDLEERKRRSNLRLVD